MSTKRLVFLYYAFQFFFSLLLWVPIFYAYQQQLGLTDPEIFKIQSVYYIAFCVLEIPTGMMADAIGRRRSMRWGAAVLVLANLLVVGIPTFIGAFSGFIVHWLLIALSRSLISGASSAYLYDALQHRGDKEIYKRAEGNARAYGLIGKVACWAGIGFLMQWHFTLPYWLTAAAGLCAFTVSLMLPQDSGIGDAEASPVPGAPFYAAAPLDGRVRRGRRSSPLTLLPQAFGIIRGSPKLALLMVQGVGLFTLVRLVQVNLFQPILTAKGFGVATFGIVLAGSSLFEAAGSARPAWMRRFVGDFNAVTILTVVMAASMSVMAVGNAWVAVAALAVFSFVAGISFPIQRQVLNDAIPLPALRATLLSMESIVDRSVCAWAALQLGDYLGAGKLNHFLHGAAVVAGIVTLAVAIAVNARNRTLNGDTHHLAL